MDKDKSILEKFTDTVKGHRKHRDGEPRARR